MRNHWGRVKCEARTSPFYPHSYLTISNNNNNTNTNTNNTNIVFFAATQSFDRMHGYLAPQHKPPRSTNIKPYQTQSLTTNRLQQHTTAQDSAKDNKDIERSEKIREAGIVGNDIGLHPHAAHLPQQLQDFGPSSQAAQLGDDFGVLPKR